jgi:hypothetical protein
MGQLLILPIATFHPPKPVQKKGPAKVICFDAHDIELGPHWLLGVRVVVCHRCGREWVIGVHGDLEPLEEDCFEGC